MQAIHESLKKCLCVTYVNMSQALNSRVSRALGRQQRTSICKPDHAPDGHFIFLWITFNGAYAQGIPQHLRLPEQENFTVFLRKLHSFESAKKRDDPFTDSILLLIVNLYVFAPFWSFHRREIDNAKWQTRQATGRRKAIILPAQAMRRNCRRWSFNASTLWNQPMHGSTA